MCGQGLRKRQISNGAFLATLPMASILVSSCTLYVHKCVAILPPVLHIPRYTQFLSRCLRKIETLLLFCHPTIAEGVSNKTQPQNRTASILLVDYMIAVFTYSMSKRNRTFQNEIQLIVGFGSSHPCYSLTSSIKPHRAPRTLLCSHVTLLLCSHVTTLSPLQ